MSTESHNHKHADKADHGATGSYIIGFILSLIFTIIPYHLVVNKVVSGNALLAIIIGIAVWQMTIQLFFFLHLGRGPKPLYNVVFFFATAGVIVVTIGASLFIMHNLYENMSPSEIIIKQAQDENIAQIGGKETGACNENRNSFLVTIDEGVATPGAVEAMRCDTITFINEDKQAYTLVFASGSENVSYGGVQEIVLDDSRPETITLNQLGDFMFRDRDDSPLSIRVVVSERKEPIVD